MARRRKSKIGRPKRERKLTSDEKKRFELQARSSSGTIDGPRFGFSTHYQGKVDCCVFRARFAAHVYLMAMLEDDEFDWVSDEELVTFDGMRIRGIGLRSIYDYKLKKVEQTHYSLSEDHKKRCLSMRLSGPARPFLEGETQTRRRTKSRKYMIKIEAIAEELGMTPRACRGALRRERVEKPEWGWAWETREEADKIKRLISGKRGITIDLSKAEKPDED